eukprot:1963000-Rhodomonas_salina.2
MVLRAYYAKSVTETACGATKYLPTPSVCDVQYRERACGYMSVYGSERECMAICPILRERMAICQSTERSCGYMSVYGRVRADASGSLEGGR